MTTTQSTPAPEPLLRLEDLWVELEIHRRWTPVVRGVSMTLGRGEFVGVVGESGSGKSLTALSMIGLLPPVARARGHAWLAAPASGATAGAGKSLDVLALKERELCRVRGGRIGMVFQEPSTSLNPVLSVGYQIAEAVRAHRAVSRSEARREALRLLDLVALPDAGRRIDDYPHQLSGGQRQRIMIAIALAGQPDLLLADEPTTALDVTIQAQILSLLDSLRRDLGLTVLLITHDLAVVAETCERVLVMYAGQVVEEAPVEELFRRPAHPYSRGLLAALPRLGAARREGGLATIPGQVPTPASLPTGCAFHPRCAEVMPHCSLREPDFYPVPAPLDYSIPAPLDYSIPAPLDGRAAAENGTSSVEASATARARCFLYDEPAA